MRVTVDWSSLTALSERKFRGLEIAYIKCTVPDILYTIVPEWLRRIPKIVDEPETPIPEDQTPKKKRHVGRTDNDMVMVIGKADANMDDGMDDMNDQENIAEVEVNNLINEMVTELNLYELGADTMESTMGEFHKQHAAKIREYKSRIFDWKIKFQHL